MSASKSAVNESFLDRINNKIHSVSKDGLLIPAKLSIESTKQRRPKHKKKGVSTTTTHIESEQQTRRPIVEDTAENFEQQFMLRFHNAELWTLPSMRAFSDILSSYWIRNDDGIEHGCPRDTAKPHVVSGMSFDPLDYAIRSVKTPPSRLPRHVESQSTRPASAVNSNTAKSPTPMAQISDGGRRSVPLKEKTIPQAALVMPPSIFIQNSIEGRNIQTPAPWANYPTAKQTLLFPTITTGPTYSNNQTLTKSEAQQLSYAVVQESEEERTNELLFFDSFVQELSRHEAAKPIKKKPPVIKTTKPLLNDALSHAGSTFTDKYRQSFPEASASKSTPHIYSGDNSQEESRMRKPLSLPQLATRDLGYTRAKSSSRQSESRQSSRSGSSVGSRGSVLPFSIPERLPGGLGPDLDSEEYKRKMAMAQRRKEYSVQVKQLKFPPPKIYIRGEKQVKKGRSFAPLHAEGGAGGKGERWEAESVASDRGRVMKKPSIRTGKGEFRDLVEAHERLLKIKHFSKGVKKPRLRDPKETLPPVTQGFQLPKSITMSPLEKMRIDHQRDCQTFEDFKKTLKKK